MFLIGEFSKITKVSLRMLRYYDKNDLFKPKTKDEVTGYRYYTADQIDDLYRIIQLRDLGFGIEEIADILKQSEKDEILEVLLKKKLEITDEMKALNVKLSKLEALRSDIIESESELMPEISIVMKDIPTQEVISLRKTIPDYYAEGDMWRELTEILGPYGYDEKCEAFSLYHDVDYREENVDIEVCVVAKGGVSEVPKGLIHRQIEGCEHAASIVIHGSYDNISKAYKKFAFWLEKHPEYMMSGPNRQICHVSGRDTPNQENYITELLIPLKIKYN